MSQEEIPKSKDFKHGNDLQNVSLAFFSLSIGGKKNLQSPLCT